jgi:hypothetical protein
VFQIAGEHSSWIDSESQSSGGSLAKNNNNKFMTVLLGPTTKQRQEKDNWNRKGERSYLTMSNDPGSYVCAQRKLKRAVVEHYRLVKKVLCAHSRTPTQNNDFILLP